VDEYVERVRGFVRVRVEDRLVIKRPNHAFRINDAGIRILDRLFNRGESVMDIVNEQRDRERVAGDLTLFFRDLRCLLTHGLDERHRSPAVRVVPFAFPFSSYPILSEIAVTYRCNLRCRFCYAGCNCTRRPEQDSPELATGAVRRLLDIMAEDARVPSVSFTGGEPTLRNDLPQLVAHARGLGLRVNLITNGTCVDGDGVRCLVDAGLNSAQVSLEGTSAQTHDALTRQRGSFARSVATLHAFRAAGIVVHSNTTLNRMNVEDAVRFPAFVRDAGLPRFSMNLMMPAGSGSEARELLVTYTEAGPLVDRIHAEARRCGVEFHWYSPTPLCLFNPIARGLGNKGCAACDGLLSVAPNGDVLPCSSYPRPVGNLLRDGFEATWFGPKARHFRRKDFAHPACRRCGDFAACQGACPIYWEAVGYGELPAAGGACGVVNQRRTV
jgi:radical SAM protein with 4Fe4S-binding SPASM domain